MDYLNGIVTKRSVPESAPITLCLQRDGKNKGEGEMGQLTKGDSMCQNYSEAPV